MAYKYTSEELLSQPDTIERMEKGLYSKDINHICNHLKMFHSNSSKYKQNIYYHIVTEKEEYGSGVGEGLYLGRDKDVLVNFYGVDFNYEDVQVMVYYGNPNFLDLTDKDEFNKYKIYSKKKFPNEDNNNELKKMTIELGYDGIRYYDPIATGEEFVLYNIDKVKLIKQENK